MHTNINTNKLKLLPHRRQLNLQFEMILDFSEHWSPVMGPKRRLDKLDIFRFPAWRSDWSLLAKLEPLICPRLCAPPGHSTRSSGARASPGRAQLAVSWVEGVGQRPLAVGGAVPGGCYQRVADQRSVHRGAVGGAGARLAQQSEQHGDPVSVAGHQQRTLAVRAGNQT